ncbi:MAG: CRTAC1 family protein [Planctomycetota bacterium]
MTHSRYVRVSVAAALALAAPTMLWAQDTPPANAPWFQEVAEASGIDWTYVSGATEDFWFPEIMGGGLALLDYDGDGDLDVYLVQSGSLHDAAGEGPGNKLYRNDCANGEWRFTDVTDAAGVGDTGYGMGAACGDFDRDGDVDLFVTNVGANVLYQNNGNGTFTNATAKMKVGDERWGTSAAFFDADGNGTLDLYVVNNLGWSPENETPCFNYKSERDYCSPNNYNAPATDLLYTYGRLGFTDSSTRAGINVAFGNGLGVTVGDHDQDGDLDVYVANDATANLLWQNDGKGVFTNVAPEGGCAVNANGTPEAGMGVQFLDLDEDGDLDLFMTHLRREKNTFYANNRGRYRDASNMTGMAGVSAKFTGFGMGFQDFDLDGVRDLFVANGAVQQWPVEDRFADDPYAEPNHLFRGKQQGKRFVFELVDDPNLAALVGTSRGAAFGDLDNDGAVDIVYVDRDARVKVLRNVAARKGSWVGFEVVDTKGRGVHCATVSVAHGAERRLYRQADPCYSYLSSNDPRAHFGLGDMTEAKEVKVQWPNGVTETFGDFAAGAYHTLKQGAGK